MGYLAAGPQHLFASKWCIQSKPDALLPLVAAWRIRFGRDASPAAHDTTIGRLRALIAVNDEIGVVLPTGKRRSNRSLSPLSKVNFCSGFRRACRDNSVIVIRPETDGYRQDLTRAAIACRRFQYRVI